MVLDRQHKTHRPRHQQKRFTVVHSWLCVYDSLIYFFFYSHFVNVSIADDSVTDMPCVCFNLSERHNNKQYFGPNGKWGTTTEHWHYSFYTSHRQQTISVAVRVHSRNLTSFAPRRVLSSIRMAHIFLFVRFFFNCFFFFFCFFDHTHFAQKSILGWLLFQIRIRSVCVIQYVFLNASCFCLQSAHFLCHPKYGEHSMLNVKCITSIADRKTSAQFQKVLQSKQKTSYK